MEIEYPDREAALAAHAEAMEIQFERARDALLKDDQLESAVAPQERRRLRGRRSRWQAATLFWGLTSNHPFQDGNKRTAVVLLYAFLRANDHDLTLTDDELLRWPSRWPARAGRSSRSTSGSVPLSFPTSSRSPYSSKRRGSESNCDEPSAIR